MKNKKIKLNNKQIVALSAVLVLTLALSGFLLMSDGDAISGYQTASVKKGFFTDPAVGTAGPQYFKMSEPGKLVTLKKNVKYNDWDVLFTTDVYHNLVLIPRQSSTKIVSTNVNYNSATTKDCESALVNAQKFPDLTDVPIDSTNRLPAIGSYPKFTFDPKTKKGIYSANTVCVKTPTSEVMKVGVLNLVMDRNDVYWEVLQQAPEPTPFPIPPLPQPPTPTTYSWLGKPEYSGSASQCSVKVPLYYKVKPGAVAETLVAPVIAFDTSVLDYKFELEKLTPPLVMQEEYMRDSYLTLRIGRKDRTLADDNDHIVPSTKLGTLTFAVKKPTVSSSVKLYFVSTSHDRNRATSVLVNNDKLDKSELEVKILSNCGQPTPTPSPTPSPTPVKSVKLLSPNGGEALKSGEVYRIKWDSKGVNKVNLYLKVSPSVMFPIVTDLSNQGFYDWKVDIGVQSGNTLRVRVADAESPSIVEESDGDFTVLKPTPTPELKPARVSIPIILESSTVSLLTGKSIWRYVTGYAPASSSKNTVTVKLSYDNKILKYTDLTLRTGADVKAKVVSPGKLEITYTTDKDLSPGELFKVNFEKLDPKSTNVTLDTALEDGTKPVKIKRSTSVVKAT